MLLSHHPVLHPFRPFAYRSSPFHHFRIPKRIHTPRQSLGRHSSTTSGTEPPPKSSSQARLSKFISRTPQFLQPWIAPILNAPVSHVTSFLVLHELTAIVPLFGLAFLFHTTGWLPGWFAEGEWLVKGTQKLGAYARRKGWVTEAQEKKAEGLAQAGRAEDVEYGQNGRLKSTWRSWRRSRETNSENRPLKARLGTMLGTTENATRLLVEFSTAYAIVKVLFPVRIIASAWATPWFARCTVMPITNLARRILTGR